MRTAAFVVVTAVLTVLGVVRVGRWALAEPVQPLAAAPSATSTTSATTTAPAFLDGPVVRFHAARPSTTTPTRSWTWDQLAQCESRNRWDAVRGVYQGGLQFDARTWDHYAPASGFPADAHLATRAQQITIAERVLAAQGVRAWPTCGPRIGMTGGPATDANLPPAGPPDEIDDDLVG